MNTTTQTDTSLGGANVPTVTMRAIVQDRYPGSFIGLGERWGSWSR